MEHVSFSFSATDYQSKFILKSEHAYSDDYPAEDTPIEVTGVLASYKEEGNTYYYVAADGSELVSLGVSVGVSAL